MSANDTQVGGSHYKRTDGAPEHWDLSVMYKWDSFQHCITKYIMRWKDKYPTREQRLLDLKKAAHMLQKYIEVYETYDDRQPVEKKEDTMPRTGVLTLQQYELVLPFITQPTDYLAFSQKHENVDWATEGVVDTRVLYRHRHTKTLVLAMSITEAYQLYNAAFSNAQEPSKVVLAGIPQAKP